MASCHDKPILSSQKRPFSSILFLLVVVLFLFLGFRRFPIEDENENEEDWNLKRPCRSPTGDAKQGFARKFRTPRTGSLHCFVNELTKERIRHVLWFIDR